MGAEPSSTGASPVHDQRRIRQMPAQDVLDRLPHGASTGSSNGLSGYTGAYPAASSSALRSRSGSSSDSASRTTMFRPGTDRPDSMKLRYRCAVPARRQLQLTHPVAGTTFTKRTREVHGPDVTASGRTIGDLPAVRLLELPCARPAPRRRTTPCGCRRPPDALSIRSGRTRWELSRHPPGPRAGPTRGSCRSGWFMACGTTKCATTLSIGLHMMLPPQRTTMSSQLRS